MKETAPPVYRYPGGAECFMYSVCVSYIFGTAETKNETADRPEENQHKTKTDTMAKCPGQPDLLQQERLYTQVSNI